MRVRQHSQHPPKYLSVVNLLSRFCDKLSTAFLSYIKSKDRGLRPPYLVHFKNLTRADASWDAVLSGLIYDIYSSSEDPGHPMIRDTFVRGGTTTKRKHNRERVSLYTLSV